ncbi:MAG: hypothetical protein WAN35_06600 [Terracidiphilus sp.]
MKRFVSMMLLAAIYLTSGLILHSQASQQTHPLRRHWAESESETLWTVQYTNEDYGYYVLLGSGVVGHGSHSPAPNHGFLVLLPNVGKTTFASVYEEERYVWTGASYDVIDDQSLAGALFDVEKMSEERRGKPQIAKNISTKLAGRQAVLSKVEYTTSKGMIVEETIITVRCGIVYRIGLRTHLENLAADEEQFQKIVNGFHLLKLPKGECSSG